MTNERSLGLLAGGNFCPGNEIELRTHRSEFGEAEATRILRKEFYRRVLKTKRSRYLHRRPLQSCLSNNLCMPG